MSQERAIGIAVIGLGTVGTSVVGALEQYHDDFAARIGSPIIVRGVAVRDLSKPRSVKCNNLTDDALSLIEREDVDLVIEVAGGIDPVKSWLTRALELGKSVITANKMLIADHLGSLAEVAARSRADLYYEAAVAGAIPVIRPIQQSLAGDIIHRVTGIVNGTTNYILTQMDQHGEEYATALAQAQAKGYAESDPTADVEGIDSAAKAAILSSIAFHTIVNVADVYREGISRISQEDIAAARTLGRVIKLLSICELVDTPSGRAISARVYPALVPLNHPIGKVDDANNAIVVDSKYSGQLMFYGQGAGGDPTASAILGDVIMAARNKALSGRGPLLSDYANVPILPVGNMQSRVYIALIVDDKPGVLASISALFAKVGVSIATVMQQTSDALARIIITTHESSEDTFQELLRALNQLESVHTISSVLRLEF